MLWPDDFPEMRTRRPGGGKPTLLGHDGVKGWFARHDGVLYELGPAIGSKREATIVTNPEILTKFGPPSSGGLVSIRPQD